MLINYYIFVLFSTPPALLIPKLQTRLLPQDSIHGAAIQAFPRVLPRRQHVLPSNLQPRQWDIMLLGDGKRMIGVLDGQRDTKPRTGVQGWCVGTGCQSKQSVWSLAPVTGKILLQTS